MENLDLLLVFCSFKKAVQWTCYFKFKKTVQSTCYFKFKKTVQWTCYFKYKYFTQQFRLYPFFNSLNLFKKYYFKSVEGLKNPILSYNIYKCNYSRRGIRWAGKYNYQNIMTENITDQINIQPEILPFSTKNITFFFWQKYYHFRPKV